MKRKTKSPFLVALLLIPLVILVSFAMVVGNGLLGFIFQPDERNSVELLQRRSHQEIIQIVEAIDLYLDAKGSPPASLFELQKILNDYFPPFDFQEPWSRVLERYYYVGPERGETKMLGPISPYLVERRGRYGNLEQGYIVLTDGEIVFAEGERYRSALDIFERRVKE